VLILPNTVRGAVARTSGSAAAPVQPRRSQPQLNKDTPTVGVDQRPEVPSFNK
jgi:hypothetical protein